MALPFHPGELAVQERAGVRDQAARIGGSIHRTIPDPARRFLEDRSWIVVAGAGPDGRPWTSLLGGAPGFVRVLDAATIRIAAEPALQDPLGPALASSRFAGLLAIDLATRRRMRLNGRVDRDADGVLLLRSDQVYANCQKYIQRRPEPWPGPAPQRTAGHGTGLSDAQREWVRRANTFFIATVNPGEGADASHRGGPPGFVAVEGDRLTWPDYAGNMMYNTLGNIAAHPRAGLLVPDFESGALLQLTGRAAIDWDPRRAAEVAGAERLVTLAVEQVVQLDRP
jgi:predicted pyridoxine 5'-phosphate oxidase superfamily flavin-nucleotide-binding protein